MKETQTLLIELDALIDTRVGTLKQHFPDECAKLDLAKYVKRIKKDFWTELGISDERWEKAWNGRDVETLLHSTFTGLYHNIPMLLSGHLLSRSRTPDLGELKLCINTWPYKLEEDEMEDIKFSIQARLIGECDISTVHIAPAELDPQLLTCEYKTYLLYDLETWIGAHKDAIIDQGIPTVTVYYPAVINHYKEEEFNYMMEKKINPFTDLRQRMAEYLTLDAVDADIFSCHYPHQSL